MVVYYGNLSFSIDVFVFRLRNFKSSLETRMEVFAVGLFSISLNEGFVTSLSLFWQEF